MPARVPARFPGLSSPQTHRRIAPATNNIDRVSGFMTTALWPLSHDPPSRARPFFAPREVAACRHPPLRDPRTELETAGGVFDSVDDQARTFQRRRAEHGTIRRLPRSAIDCRGRPGPGVASAEDRLNREKTNDERTCCKRFVTGFERGLVGQGGTMSSPASSVAWSPLSVVRFRPWGLFSLGGLSPPAVPDEVGRPTGIEPVTPGATVRRGPPHDSNYRSRPPDNSREFLRAIWAPDCSETLHRVLRASDFPQFSLNRLGGHRSPRAGLRGSTAAIRIRKSWWSIEPC